MLKQIKARFESNTDCELLINKAVNFEKVNKNRLISQVCIGAVQRPLLADMHACHARPPVLPACPPGCADPDVQRHPQHALAA